MNEKEEKTKGGGGWEQAAGRQDQNYNVIFHSNAAELYSCPRQMFVFSEQGGGEEVGGRGGEGGEQLGGEGGGRRGRTGQRDHN